MKIIESKKYHSAYANFIGLVIHHIRTDFGMFARRDDGTEISFHSLNDAMALSGEITGDAAAQLSTAWDEWNGSASTPADPVMAKNCRCVVKPLDIAAKPKVRADILAAFKGIGPVQLNTSFSSIGEVEKYHARIILGPGKPHADVAIERIGDKVLTKVTLNRKFMEPAALNRFETMAVWPFLKKHLKNFPESFHGLPLYSEQEKKPEPEHLGLFVLSTSTVYQDKDGNKYERFDYPATELPEGELPSEWLQCKKGEMVWKPVSQDMERTLESQTQVKAK